MKEKKNNVKKDDQLNFKNTKVFKIIAILLIIALIILFSNYILEKYIKKENPNGNDKKTETVDSKEKPMNIEEGLIDDSEIEKILKELQQEVYNLEKIETKEQFNKMVKLDKAVFLFTIPGCRPCDTQIEIYRDIKAKNEDTRIFVVPISKGQLYELAEELDIKVSPTSVFYKNGKQEHKNEGIVLEKDFSQLYN